VRVLNLVISEDGLKETHYASARRDVGFGSRYLIEKAFERANIHITPSRIAALQALFLKLYAEDIAQKSRQFPGVMDTLMALKKAGANLSVCTNKPGYLARPLLQKLGMSEIFDRIVGSDDVPHKKPHPGHIYAAAGHKSRKSIIMIGDSLPDILAAKNAKISSIAVSYGYCPIAVEKLGADAVIRRFKDLPSALKDIST